MDFVDLVEQLLRRAKDKTAEKFKALSAISNSPTLFSLNA